MDLVVSISFFLPLPIINFCSMADSFASSRSVSEYVGMDHPVNDKHIITKVENYFVAWSIDHGAKANSQKNMTSKVRRSAIKLYESEHLIELKITNKTNRRIDSGTISKN